MAKKRENNSDDERSLGDQASLAGGYVAGGDVAGGYLAAGPMSLGDQASLAGGGPSSDTHSLGDGVTFGGAAGGDEAGGDEDLEVVDLAARYKTEKTLGRGGMGEVLLATDTRLNRKVAIKRILGQAARSRTAVQRFLTEAQSIAALNHPNIVQIYDYGRAADGPFLIMEYVEGDSLLDRCRQGALDAAVAVSICGALCDGLGKAHAAGIIHRDIKPANILLTADGVPKLTDFGLAKAEAADTGMTMAGAVLGTLDFMPPEQRRDAALADARSDLWSLAATFYQMVTGESPRVIDLDQCPDSLRRVLAQALKTQSDARFQTAAEFKTALHTALAADEPVAIEQGACPHCGTKNELHRKFCKNATCGRSLVVSCLSCDSKISMWEEVCGECGSRQTPLIEQRRLELVSERERAERLLEQLEFGPAAKIAKRMVAAADLRLPQFRSWGERFLVEVEQKRAEIRQRTAQLVGEALQHERAFDYQAALHALNQVPRSQQEEQHASVEGWSAAGLQQRISEKRERAEQLEKTIRERVRKRELHGVETEVQALLALLPNHAAMLKLQADLVARDAKLTGVRDEAYAAAKERFPRGDFAGVLKEVGRIDSHYLRPDIEALRDTAKSRLRQVEALQKQISSAVESKRYSGLLADVDALLELTPDDAAMLKLQKEMVASLQREIAKKIADAGQLCQDHRYQESLRVIGQLMTITDQRVAVDTEQLEQLKHATQQAWDEQTAFAAAKYKEAQQHRAAFDYPSAIRAIESIPIQMRDGKTKQYSVRLKADYDDSVSLLAKITTRVRDKAVDGLLPLVDRAIELSGDRADLSKLRNQLTERETRRVRERGAAFELAERLLEEGKANEGWQAVSKYYSDRLTNVQQAFVNRIEGLLASEKALAALLKEAKADGVIDPHEIVLLLSEVLKYLQMNPRHAVAKSLYHDLFDRFCRCSSEQLLAVPVQKLLTLPADFFEHLPPESITKLPPALIRKLPPISNSIGQHLKLLPPGKFLMGEGKTCHEVTLTRAIYMDVHEVTQEQYERVMGQNPSHFKGEKCPVERVSWDDAVEFCIRLSAMPEERAAGRGYRLPTEAEWEYACRAGSQAVYSFGDNEIDLGHYAWFDVNSCNMTHPVGIRRSNAWGLYDMHGNVWEWCSDWYGDYPSGAVSDPTGPRKGSFRVLRGGSWSYEAANCRSARRGRDDPSVRYSRIGFRVAMSFPSGATEYAEAEYGQR